MPLPLSALNLTGATRYRESRWGRKLILQVEETYQEGYGGRPRLGQPTCFTATRWRDATTRDLYGLECLNRRPPPDCDAGGMVLA